MGRLFTETDMRVGLRWAYDRGARRLRRRQPAEAPSALLATFVDALGVEPLEAGDTRWLFTERDVVAILNVAVAAVAALPPERDPPGSASEVEEAVTRGFEEMVRRAGVQPLEVGP